MDQRSRLNRLITRRVLRVQGRAQERGAAAVEMALVGTLLLTLALGGGEYGLLMSSKHDLNVATRLAGRVGSTPCADTGSGTSTSGCNKGNTDYDDFTMLRAIESGLGGKMADVEKVVIYGTPARVGTTAFGLNSGRPPSICLGAASGVNYTCNIYTDATLISGTSLNLFDNLDYFYLADGGFDRTKLDATFNCTAGSASPTKPFCPTGSDANGIPLRLRSLNGATSMGIYVKMKHNFVTGFLRDQQNLSDWTMFRLEPHPLVNETLRQCDPSVDPACIAAPTSVQINITDATVAESSTAGNCATVRVSINVALDTPQSVVLRTSDDTAVAGSDYTAQNITVNLPAGVTSQDVCIPILNDNFWEQPESFWVELQSGSAGLKDASGNLSGKTTGTVTINDDDPQPTMSVNNISVNEGGTGSFTVTLSQAMSIPASFNWSTTDGTAVSPADFTSVPLTGVTFAPGETTKTIQVVTKTDTLTEPSETFTVNLVILSGANPTGSDLSGTGTIVDQTPPPVISIGNPPAAVNEGSSLVFPVTLDHASSSAMSVKYTTVGGTATNGVDYTSKTNANLNIAAGSTSATITISTTNDSIDELSPEDFTVVLSNPSAPLTIGTGTATGLINDNDNPPTVSVNSVTVTEGTTATFTVTLSNASYQAVTVTFNTSNVTAIAGIDYTAVSTTLTFAPGTTTQTVNVLTNNDVLIEPTKTFTVTVVGGTGSAANTATGTGTILDNDTTTTTSTTTTTRPTTTTSTTSTTTTRPATTTTRATTSTTTTRPASTTSTSTTTTRPTTTTSTTTTTRPTTTSTSTTTTRPTTTTSTTTTTRPTTTTTRPTTTTTRPATTTTRVTTTTVVIIDGNT